jgi:hypothetical protein
MKSALLIVGVVVLLAAALVGGYLYASWNITGRLSLPLVGNLGPASAGRGQFARGQFAQDQGARQANGTPGAQRAFGQGNGQGGGPGGAFGAIESIEGGLITVKTQTGSIKVKATDTTLIDKQVTVTVQDLQVGDQVTVSGSQGTDGVTTARSIRVITPRAQ